MRYAVIVKHAMRDNGDIRVDIFDVPRECESIGPYEIKKYVERKLLGYFEVICVTDRISQQVFPVNDFVNGENLPTAEEYFNQFKSDSKDMIMPKNRKDIEGKE